MPPDDDLFPETENGRSTRSSIQVCLKHLKASSVFKTLKDSSPAEVGWRLLETLLDRLIFCSETNKFVEKFTSRQIVRF